MPEDPRGDWLNRLDEDTRPGNASNFNRFMAWLHTKPDWEYATPRDLLIRHIQAEDDYVLLDLVQEYVGQLKSLLTICEGLASDYFQITFNDLTHRQAQSAEAVK